MREAAFEKRFDGTVPAARLDEAWDKYHATDGPFGAWAALKERTDWMVVRVKGPYVLDVGCGSGLLSCLASLRPGIVSVLGVDPLQAACDLTESRGKGKVVAQRGWAEDMPFYGDGNAHTVLMGETLQHALNPCEALAEARRVLDRDGALIVSVPEGGPPAFDHLRRFTREQLFALVELAGFRVDEFKRIVPWLCLMAHKADV